MLHSITSKLKPAFMSSNPIFVVLLSDVLNFLNPIAAIIKMAITIMTVNALDISCF